MSKVLPTCIFRCKSKEKHNGGREGKDITASTLLVVFRFKSHRKVVGKTRFRQIFLRRESRWVGFKYIANFLEKTILVEGFLFDQFFYTSV